MAWEGLIAVYQHAVDIAREERGRRPHACPNDGTPLVEDSHGGLRCPFDGWSFPEGYVVEEPYRH